MVRLFPDAAQVAVTVIFDVMVPLALLLKVQVCPVGCVWTVTEYVEPLAKDVAKVCVLFDAKLRVSLLLSCTTRVPEVSPVVTTLIV